MIKPIIIVIEGVDGAGKNTQATLLEEYLIQLGIKAWKVSFPQYGDFFGKEIGHYLNGGFGDINSVPTKLISTMYALDRYKFFQDNKEKIEKHNVLIFDRYVDSNLIYQSNKPNVENKDEVHWWLYQLEHEILGSPKPDLSLFLDVNYTHSSAQVLKKETRDYTNKKQDLHEANKGYLEKVYKDFRIHFCLKKAAHHDMYHTINCLDAFNNMLPPDHIHMYIRGSVSPFIRHLL